MEQFNRDIGDLENLSCRGLDSIKNLAGAIQEAATENKVGQAEQDKIYAFAISIEQLAQNIRESFYKILDAVHKERKNRKPQDVSEPQEGT